MSPERTDKTARWIIELQSMLLSTDELDDFLQEVAAAAVRSMPAAKACGVTLQPNGRARTVAASSELANQVDEIQYASDQGPCLQAMRTDETVYAPDLGQEDRWPGFTVAALGYGVLTVLSLPLRGLRASIGALNLYSMERDPFAIDSRREAAGYAEFAAGAVDLALRMAHHRQLSADLQAALASREVIDQAVGIIMAQQRCLPREAFAVLRRMSQLRNVKLAAVSAAIVAGVSGHPPQPGRFTAR